MKTFEFENVDIKSGFWKEMQELNEKVTVNAVYDRFYDTGRIGAFDFNWKEGMDKKPHIFWDSDVAKWMEGSAYILQKHPERRDLEEKIDDLVEKIEKNQCEDGYFNIYFTVCEPEKRFKDRNCHELYCAGHLMEAAVAYAKVTGKTKFLQAMEKYAEYIYKVFAVEKSAAFVTPGHEEIEIALVKMYRFTGRKLYLDLAVFFINQRGNNEIEGKTEYNQSNMPVRELSEAEGHSVRAVYLYTAMADIAKETEDSELQKACERLFEDITERKMYVTGGIGSCYIGETFSKSFDLPNEEAYTETCAGIGLMFFANKMMALDNDGKYADIIERAFYNGVLSGLSLDGKSFFYENPLEITMLDHFTGSYGTKRYPITQRLQCFDCSCCPPNIVRLLASLGNYIYGYENDTLYINQFAESTLNDGKISCTLTTNYPKDGSVKVTAKGATHLAIRIPSWCDEFKINAEYSVKNGYAYVEIRDGQEILVDFNMEPFAIRADSRVVRDIGKLCIQRGPVVYCAENADNDDIHTLAVAEKFAYKEYFDVDSSIPSLEISGFRLENGKNQGKLYARAEEPVYNSEKIRLIPYHAFANRGESDMKVWFREI